MRVALISDALSSAGLVLLGSGPQLQPGFGSGWGVADALSWSGLA